LPGYNVEYSSAGFALFFIGEYTHIIFMSVFAVILFFGGWQPPNTALERLLIFLSTPSIVYIFDFIFHLEYYIRNYPLIRYFWYWLLLSPYWSLLITFLKIDLILGLTDTLNWNSEKLCFPLMDPKNTNSLMDTIFSLEILPEFVYQVFPLLWFETLLGVALFWFFIFFVQFKFYWFVIRCLAFCFISYILCLKLSDVTLYFFYTYPITKDTYIFNILSDIFIQFIVFFESFIPFLWVAPQKFYMLLSNISFVESFTFINANTIFIIKVNLMIWLFLLARAALPRFRYDQLMRLGWKVFLPLSLFFTLFTATLIFILDAFPPIK